MSKQIVCEFQSTVVKSVKSGIANNDTDEHLKNCADCQETLRVARFFQTNLMKESPPLNLPVAGFIWWKAKLREKQRAAERVGQPITIVQTIAVVIFAGVLLWSFNTESLPLASLGEGISRVAGSMAQFIFPLIIGFVSFALVCLTTVLLMRRLLPEK
jgi:hypothetical protein